jgi:hypothetical protein
MASAFIPRLRHQGLLAGGPNRFWINIDCCASELQRDNFRFRPLLDVSEIFFRHEPDSRSSFVALGGISRAFEACTSWRRSVR